MEKATWEEIKKLAGDFQRAQLGSVAPRLTERNCVEIVSRLAEMGLLTLYYTNDAKSYLTPEELVKEIYEELEVSGGRINLVDLQQVIGVNLSVIEAKVHEMMRNDSALQLVLGQLIDASYTRRLAREIGELVEEEGHVTLGDLTKQHDLPTAFISSVVEANLGGAILAHLDGEILYTEAFICRHRSQIRGYLSAVSRPVSLGPLIARYSVPDKLFYRLVEELVTGGRLAGSLASGRSTYVPHVYTRSQETWVDNFFHQNDYVEHDALRRLGISNPGQYLQKKFPTALHLSVCSLGETLVSQVSNIIDECCSLGGWVDVEAALPLLLSPSDLSLMVGPLLKKYPGSRLLADSVVVSADCLVSCRKLFDPLMAERAEKAVRDNPKLLLPDKSTGKIHQSEPPPDSKRSKGSGKGGKTGGGQRGRETKTKSVKNKYMARNEAGGEETDEKADANGEHQVVPFMPLEEMEAILRVQLAKGEDDVPDHLVRELAVEFERPLLRSYQEVVRSVFVQTSTTGRSRASLADTQERLTGLINMVRLSEKGVLRLPSPLGASLLKHLLRSHGADLVNFLCGYVAGVHNLEWDATPTTSHTHESRLKLIDQLPHTETVLEPLKLLNQTVRGGDAEKGLDGFYAAVDSSAESLGMMLRRLDKKREKSACLEFGMKLQDQISSPDATNDPAVFLLTSVCLLCQGVIGWPISAPGRAVPQLIGWLADQVSPEAHSILTQYEEAVVQQLRAGHSGDDSLVEGLKVRLDEMAPNLRQLASGWRKIGAGSPATPIVAGGTCDNKE